MTGTNSIFALSHNQLGQTWLTKSIVPSLKYPPAPQTPDMVGNFNLGFYWILLLTHWLEWLTLFKPHHGICLCCGKRRCSESARPHNLADTLAVIKPQCGLTKRYDRGTGGILSHHFLSFTCTPKGDRIILSSNVVHYSVLALASTSVLVVSVSAL